jgi:HupE / UreJ protein
MLRRARQQGRAGLFAALIIAAAVAAFRPHSGAAHDVPDQVIVTAYIKQSAGRADMVARLPLVLLLNLDLPKVGPGYLDLAAIGPSLQRAGDAVAKALSLHDGDAKLGGTLAGARISLPSDKSFVDYASARAAIHGPPLPPTETVLWNQGFYDAHLTYALAQPTPDLVLRVDLTPALGDRLHVGLTFLAPNGAARIFDIRGGMAEVRLDPRWFHAAGRFVVEGTSHILSGVDHLLFLLCLVVPFRQRFYSLLGVVTGFTVGHSITLAAAALGAVPTARWFSPLIETLIAASILYMAVENVIGARIESRWLVATGFGLVHGFGFAGSLAELLPFAGSHFVLALFSFNLGIELGQVLALAVAIPLLNLLFRNALVARWGVLAISVLVGHEAWHWMTSRAAAIPLAELAAIDPADAYRVALWGVTLAFLAALASAALHWLIRLRRIRVPEKRGTPAQ